MKGAVCLTKYIKPIKTTYLLTKNNLLTHKNNLLTAHYYINVIYAVNIRDI